MSISREHFSYTLDRQAVSVYTLRGSGGAVARIMDYGAIIQSLSLPVGGAMRDVVLGFDSLLEYEKSRGCFGAVCGRCANRVREGRFTLNGREQFLTLNARGRHHLHGGVTGFDRRVWRAEGEGDTLHLHLHSPDGEEGYPGAVDVTVSYTLDADNALHIRYRARSDGDTILNLTNHSYFNLNGHGSGSVATHRLRLASERITAVDADGMSDGRFVPVAGTWLDFRQPRALAVGLEQGGFDHNFVLDAQDQGVRSVAWLTVKDLAMTVDTDQPGVQLFTANQLKGLPGKEDALYHAFGAVCLETQHYPNSPEHPHFPSVVLRSGETFTSETVYRFTAR